MGKIELPSGKHTKNYGKSPFFMGKSTISMAMFNSYVKLPEGKNHEIPRVFRGFPLEFCRPQLIQRCLYATVPGCRGVPVDLGSTGLLKNP